MASELPTNDQELNATMHQLLVDHTNTMHQIQQGAFERFMKIAAVQLRAIDRVLEDKSQRLATDVAQHV